MDASRQLLYYSMDFVYNFPLLQKSMGCLLLGFYSYLSLS